MAAPILLIPIDAAWTTELSARTALTGNVYWKLEIDEGAGYIDRTSLLDDNQISIEASGSVFDNSTASSASWVFRNLPKVFTEGDLANYPVKISAKVGAAGYIQMFSGYVEPYGCQRGRKNNRADTITVKALDPAQYRGLQRKTSNTAYLNYKICDTGTPAASLLHALASEMGLVAADLDVIDVLSQKDYVGTDASRTVWAELQDMAKQHGAYLGFRYDGKLRFIVWTAAEWNAAATEYTFDSTNVHSFTAKGRGIVCNKAKTEFSRYYALPAGSLIYKNQDDWDETYSRNAIDVTAGQYWPGGTDSLAVGQLGYGKNGEKYPIGTAIITPTIGRVGSGSDIECEGGVLTLVSFNGSTGDTRQNLDSSEIILRNNEGGTVTIRKFELRGTPLREVKKITVEHIDATVVSEWEEREITLPGKYATDETQAKVTVKRWVDFGNIPRKEYEVPADFTPHMQCGALVRFNPLADLDLVCQVVGYKHTSKGPHGNTRTTLKLVERIDFSAVGDGEVVVVTPPPPPPATPIPEGNGLLPTGRIDGAGQPIPATWELFDFSNPSGISSWGRRPEPTPYFYHEPARLGIKGNPLTLWTAGKTTFTEVTSDMIDRGDCESATPPMITGETVPLLSNATWARDNAFAHGGTFGYKFTKTVAAGTYGRVFITDSIDTADLHGLTIGLKIVVSIWIYIPAASGILGSEITFDVGDYQGAWAATTATAANIYDDWQLVQVERTVRGAATGAYIRINAEPAASINEYFYCDDITAIVSSFVATIDDVPDTSWRGCAGYFRASRNLIATKDLNDSTKWSISATYHSSYGNIWDEDLEQIVWRWKRGTNTTWTRVFDTDQDPGAAGNYALSLLVKTEEDLWFQSYIAGGTAVPTLRQMIKITAGAWTRVEQLCSVTGDPAGFGFSFYKDPGGHSDIDANKYIYACNPQVELQPHPTPYIPGNADRPAASLYYRYTWPTQFSVMMWIRPRFAFDATEGKYLISDYNGVAGAYRIALKYDITNDKFSALIGDGAAWNEMRTTTAYSATKPTNSGWKHIVASFDRTGKAVRLWEDSVEQTSSVAGAPGTITPDSTLSIGSIPLSTSPAGHEADSWIAEVVIMPELVAQATIDEVYAAGRPYYQAEELSNEDQSIRCSPSGLVLTGNAGLSFADKLGRRIDIAPSSGLLVRDSAGTRIHDTPDEIILADSLPMGHYYHARDDKAAYTLYDSTAVPWGAWTLVTSVSDGLSNIRGVRIKFRISHTQAGTTAIAVYLALRPYGFSWLSSTGDMAPIDLIHITGAFALNYLAREGTIDVPVDSQGRFEFYASGQTGASTAKRLILQQIGIWI